MMFFGGLRDWPPVYASEVVPEVVRKAFKLAQLEKPGATHIELGEDLAHQLVPTDWMPMEPRPVCRSRADERAIDAALELLRSACRPLVIAGQWRNSRAKPLKLESGWYQSVRRVAVQRRVAQQRGGRAAAVAAASSHRARCYRLAQSTHRWRERRWSRAISQSACPG
jgi:hypothetical protein